MINLIRKHPVSTYFILSFSIAWILWIPTGIFFENYDFIVLAGGWSPTISALILTGLLDGKKGIKQILNKLLKWNVSFRYYAFAIFLMTLLVIITAGINILLDGSGLDLGTIASQYDLPYDQPPLFIWISPLIFLATIFIGGPIAEELGWRGYAQPRLQQQWGPGRAGLVIGILWSLWHLPLFVYFPLAVAGFPLYFYIPLVTSLGVLFAWLYNQTGGSVLLCILFHAGINFGLGGLGSHLLTTSIQALGIATGGVVLLAVFFYKQNTH